MNKQINELAEQCAYSPTPHFWFNYEKFAELIVRECVAVMRSTSSKADAQNTYMCDDVPTTVHIINIEKHFGIK
jgi:hypothetical protein